MNREPLFYDPDFMLKYLLDENGLWLNDPFKEKGYGSPYFGVTVYETTAGYIPNVSFLKDDHHIVAMNSKIQQLSKEKGFKHYVTEDPIMGKSIKLNAFDDPRDAAYVAQFIRLNPNRSSYLIGYILRSHHIEDPTVSLIEELYNSIPNWEFESVKIDWDSTEKKYHPTKQQIEQANIEKEKLRKKIVGLKQIEANKLRLIEKFRKIYQSKGKDPSLVTMDNIEDIFRASMRGEVYKH